MTYKSVKILIGPIIYSGQRWQNIDLNGKEKKPLLYFSGFQWLIIVLAVLSLFKLKGGLSEDLVGYIMSGFGISVSLFISLLISIFDKFEKTDLGTTRKPQVHLDRLKQKKNFFKKFISITSYLVINSLLIIVLCSLTYIFDLGRNIDIKDFTIYRTEIDFTSTLKNVLILLYRTTLLYFLMNYLLLTLYITGSAYDYYMSEITRQNINNPPH